MAQRSIDSRNTCEAASMSEVVVSFLLSPLSLYSWMASTLLRFVIFLPDFVLGALHHSVLLLLAGPWCVAAICTSFLLTCLRVGLYLLHVALVVSAMAILTIGTIGTKSLTEGPSMN
ncbi:hypothetical protein ATANTOWER_030509 [Ataeniobius toweri]|uniref:Uncharacterized protein n=1 Tax=Ataeniobius toweri TaxID=208326 RepID=A0ABU7AVP5_9TELE|nr:hypothetical protein [Ataeniobius toweri]